MTLVGPSVYFFVFSGSLTAFVERGVKIKEEPNKNETCGNF